MRSRSRNKGASGGFKGASGGLRKPFEKGFLKNLSKTFYEGMGLRQKAQTHSPPKFLGKGS